MNNRCAIYGDNYIFENTSQSGNLTRAKNVVRDLVRNGVNTFVTECDSKYELGLGLYIVRLKEKNPDVHLVVVRPFMGAISSSDTDGIINMIMGKADMVRYVAETKERFARADLDRWIISHCDTILHVSGGSDHGDSRLPSSDFTGKRIISIPESYSGSDRNPGRPNNGIDLNEIIISAQQIPGRAKFDNYEELRSYLENGLRQYNRTVYTLDNIDQARHDHFVLKTVKKRLTDVRRTLKKGYTAPIDAVLEQLDELIGMVKTPYDTIDKLLKANARAIKEHDIMSYAGVHSVVLGKYAGSVLRSPTFFNPKWLNVSYKEAQWKRDVDAIIERASADIKYIIAHGENNTGAILGYYFDKLSLDGVENFLNNVIREDVPRSTQATDPIFVDINTGEVISQDFGGIGSGVIGSDGSGINGSGISISDPQIGSAESPAEGAADIAGDTLETDDSSGLYGSLNGAGINNSGNKYVAENIEYRRVILSGNPAQIDRYINAARVFGVEVNLIKSDFPV